MELSRIGINYLIRYKSITLIRYTFLSRFINVELFLHI